MNNTSPSDESPDAESVPFDEPDELEPAVVLAALAAAIVVLCICMYICQRRAQNRPTTHKTYSMFPDEAEDMIVQTGNPNEELG
ncbi:hypothetical protein DIPPA_02374 [Diplonema papillatum]|nr:hypothetical protein DIPPA_02374 [Diplonema papillatum]